MNASSGCRSDHRSGPDSHLKNYGVLRFDQSIGDKFLKKRQELLDVLLGVDEFDAKRHVLGAIDATLFAMDAMMGPETRLRPHYGRACYALFEKQRNNLAAQVVALGAGVLIQMNGDLFGGASGEHAHSSFPGATVYV